MRTSASDVADTIMAALLKDPAARTAYEALSYAGGTVYVVGGAVRDAHLGRAPKDIDLLAVGLTPDEIVEALTPLPGKIDLTGKAFGVYRYRTKDGFETEIALPREEQSTGPNHTDFDVITDPFLDPRDDLYRRDFTANAMAFDLDSGELLDPYGGQGDIENGHLRLVNPDAFLDDPLRIVRALVARARYGLEPDEHLLQSIKRYAPKIRHLPGERIQAELDKLLSADAPVEALRIAYDSGALYYLIPEVAATFGFDQKNPHHDLDVGEHLLAVLEHASMISSDPDVRLAALLHDIGKPDSFWQDEEGKGHFYAHPDFPESDDHEIIGAQYASAFMRRMRYPNDRREKVEKLIRYHMFPTFSKKRGARKFLRYAGSPEMAMDLLALREADLAGKGPGADYSEAIKMRDLLQQVLQEAAVFSLKDLAISGKELIDIGFEPGPELGNALNQLLEVVIDRPDMNDREWLLQMARDIKEERM